VVALPRKLSEPERDETWAPASPTALLLSERAGAAPLQRLVDDLAASVERPVLLDDVNMRLLAHSQQGDVDGDRARQISILQRVAPPDVVAHLERAGIRRLRGPARIPGDDRLGMKPRWCWPVRWNRALLAYLWLTDDGDPLDEHALDECHTASAEAAAMLHEQEFLVHSSRRLQRRLLAGLLGGSPLEVDRRAMEVERLKLLVPDCPVAAIVAHAYSSDEDPATDEIRAALDGAIEQCARLVPPRRALAGLHDGHGVLAVALESGHRDYDIARLADRLHGILVDELGDTPGWSPVVGVGPFADELTGLAASYVRAVDAAEVAACIADYRPVAHWRHLGVFRALSAIPRERVSTLADIHEGLAALVATPMGESLLATAETYLDLGADARAAADALHLHRSSLYYRLGKCEAVAGVNLRNGGDRLAFHLSVKLARLAGHLDGLASSV
jgi:hypothetical protein